MVFNLERLLDHWEVVGDEEYGKSLWSWSQETPLKAPVHSCFTAAKHVALVKVLISCFLLFLLLNVHSCTVTANFLDTRSFVITGGCWEFEKWRWNQQYCLPGSLSLCHFNTDSQVLFVCFFPFLNGRLDAFCFVGNSFFCLRLPEWWKDKIWAMGVMWTCDSEGKCIEKWNISRFSGPRNSCLTVLSSKPEISCCH